jgi:hypothetical protein
MADLPNSVVRHAHGKVWNAKSVMSSSFFPNACMAQKSIPPWPTITTTADPGCMCGAASLRREFGNFLTIRASEKLPQHERELEKPSICVYDPQCVESVTWSKKHR